MEQHPAKPAMRVRLRRAGLWLVPFVILAILRELLDVPDDLFAMPASRVPPTRLEGLINIATGFSLWFGLLAFLARLVSDDSPGLAAILVGMAVFTAPAAGLFTLYVLVT